MMNSQEVTSRLLAHGQQPANVQTLIELFQRDRDLFFALATAGVVADAKPWAVELAQLAGRLRALVHSGYAISTDPTTHDRQVQGATDRLRVGEVDEQELARFLQQLNGTGRGAPTGKDYAGTEASGDEVRFVMGDPAGWETDRKRLDQRTNAKPLVLRLDEPDRAAVTGGVPAYAVYGLRHSATRLVQSATAMYRGLRREGRLQSGYAFCGRLPKAYDNEGNAFPAPREMVFVVYADSEGYLFDWDWVKEDPRHSGHPIDPELRFTGDPEPVVPEAVLPGVEGINPRPFDAQHAWPSPRGDCIFCYFSDEFAYADRINNDLTVFRSLASDEPTGFKIKNVKRILDESFVQVAAPDLEVKVQAFLFAAFQRNPDKKYFHIYSVLIDAWLRSAADTEPPKIFVPRSQTACHAGA